MCPAWSKIRSAFIRERKGPANTCSFGKIGGPLDIRGWDGRSAEACLKQWVKARREATKFKATWDRVTSKGLIVNPEEEALDCSAQLI